MGPTHSPLARPRKRTVNPRRDEVREGTANLASLPPATATRFPPRPAAARESMRDAEDASATLALAERGAWPSPIRRAPLARMPPAQAAARTAFTRSSFGDGVSAILAFLQTMDELTRFVAIVAVACFGIVLGVGLRLVTAPPGSSFALAPRAAPAVPPTRPASVTIVMAPSKNPAPVVTAVAPSRVIDSHFSSMQMTPAAPAVASQPLRATAGAPMLGAPTVPPPPRADVRRLPPKWQSPRKPQRPAPARSPVAPPAESNAPARLQVRDVLESAL